jgi:pimeloyl-ACP methyl ester carboxylesterase
MAAVDRFLPVEGKYSYAETPDDRELKYFTIATDLARFDPEVYPGIKDAGCDLLPRIQEAHSERRGQWDRTLRVIASAWKAPPWMKDIETWYVPPSAQNGWQGDGGRLRQRSQTVHRIAGGPGELEPPTVGRLAEVRAPTLVIEGEMDCEDIHLIGRLVERRVAGATRVVLPGVAHMPGMEAPAEVNRLILDFLRAPGKAPVVSPRKPAEEVFVEMPGGRLWAERQGEGEAVLLVHDGIVHSPLWDVVAPLLATQYSVIRYDRRRYGRSDSPKAPFSQLDDLEKVLERFAVTKVNLVGSSAGAALCVDYALAHPEQVLSLALVGPVVGGMAVTRHLTDRGGRLTADIWKDPERFRQYWTTTDPFYLAPGSKEARARVSGEGLVRGPPPALPRLREIRVSTLMVVGEHDIADVHAHAGAIQVGVPDARRLVVPASGHGVPLERPELLSLQVLEHLQNRAFLTVLSNQGAEAAAELLRSARRANPAAVLVSEEELNRRGYERLQAGRKAEAVDLLRLGVAAFPASANTHDSLGEALLASGERDAAAAAYRRALEAPPAGK